MADPHSLPMNITGAFLHPKGGIRPPDPNLKIPIFHVVLVGASILLIVCAILTAISIYLRFLQMARRRRKSESTQNEEQGTNVGRRSRKSRNSAPAVLKTKAATCVSVSSNTISRQPLQIKIEEF